MSRSQTPTEHVLLHMFEFWSGEYTSQHIIVNNGRSSAAADEGHIIRSLPGEQHYCNYRHPTLILIETCANPNPYNHTDPS